MRCCRRWKIALPLLREEPIHDKTITINVEKVYEIGIGSGSDLWYDESGKQLAYAQVYFGNVGDKPVVAYKYISGYAPKSLGLTETLSENAAENIFTFVYTPVPAPTYNEIVNEVIVDLDDPEVPLTPGLNVDSNMLVYGAIGIAALAALIATIYLIFMAKVSKKTKE